MKILMLNTFDSGGGAARAALRLQRGLRGIGVESRMLVQFKTGAEADIIGNSTLLKRRAASLKLFLGLLPVRCYPNRPVNNFSVPLFPDNRAAEIALLGPDIVHLHWLAAGFLQPETIGKINRPVVWTLHDSWPFTGGCHVPYDCTKYRENCGSCPVLGAVHQRDISRWLWNRKNRAWRNMDLTVIAPSRWLADCARASALLRRFRIEVIPNGLDTGSFRPMEKLQARTRLKLPGDKKIILFGAVKGTVQKNKGFHLLQPALQSLGAQRKDALAVVFGGTPPRQAPDLGMPAVFLDWVPDDRTLTAIYSAADVFVVPSIQEAFCQTATEAMACGTPVVAFAATGLLDVVEHQKCGYLAVPYDTEDLGRGIDWVIADHVRQARLSQRARQKAEAEFSLDLMARRHAALYRELLDQRVRGKHG